MGLLLCFALLIVLAILLMAVPMNVTRTTYDTILGRAPIGGEPHGRGTFGIIFSSSVTFFFCVWTAVHPNIITGASMWYRLWYKFVLIFFSITLPEGVIICAFGQWREAKILHTAWRSKMKLPKRTWAEKLKLWKTADDGFGLDGAFFVIMGGFVIDLPMTDLTVRSLSSTDPILGDRPQDRITTLTPNGFLKYLDEGYIHEMTFDHGLIVGEGETGGIAKLVACFQILWFVVQCRARWTSNLPLTLLEIRIGIQVLCTIILYLFWWSKPLDVNVPIRIVLQMKGANDSLVARTTTALPVIPIISMADHEFEDHKSDECLLDRSSSNQNFVTRFTASGHVAVTAKAFHDLLIYLTEQPIWLRNQSSAVSMVLEGTLVIIIGVLHIAAWNVHFPTCVECWLWPVSSLGLRILPACIVLVTLANGSQIRLAMVLWKMQLKRGGFFVSVRDMLVEAKRFSSRQAGQTSSSLRVFRDLLLRFLSCFLIVCYILAIVFITVESFISIRDPPDGSSLTPQWINYWPHL